MWPLKLPGVCFVCRASTNMVSLPAEMAKLLVNKESSKNTSPSASGYQNESGSNARSPSSEGNADFGLGGFSTSTFVPIPGLSQTYMEPSAEMIPEDLSDGQQFQDFSWAMIELGLQEPLPPDSTIDALYGPFLDSFGS